MYSVVQEQNIEFWVCELRGTKNNNNNNNKVLDERPPSQAVVHCVSEYQNLSSLMSVGTRSAQCSERKASLGSPEPVHPVSPTMRTIAQYRVI